MNYANKTSNIYLKGKKEQPSAILLKSLQNNFPIIQFQLQTLKPMLQTLKSELQTLQLKLSLAQNKKSVPPKK
jgi:hypothetical protein